MSERDRRTADERYRAGDCTACGVPLEDVELGEGMARCGACELEDARRTVRDRSRIQAMMTAPHVPME